MSEFNCGDIVLYNGKECEVYDVMTVCLAVYIAPHLIETVDKRDVVLLKKANPPKPAPMSYQDQQAATIAALEAENARLQKIAQQYDTMLVNLGRSQQQNVRLRAALEKIDTIGNRRTYGEAHLERLRDDILAVVSQALQGGEG